MNYFCSLFYVNKLVHIIHLFTMSLKISIIYLRMAPREYRPPPDPIGDDSNIVGTEFNHMLDTIADLINENDERRQREHVQRMNNENERRRRQEQMDELEIDVIDWTDNVSDISITSATTIRRNQSNDSRSINSSTNDSRRSSIGSFSNLSNFESDNGRNTTELSPTFIELDDYLPMSVSPSDNTDDSRCYMRSLSHSSLEDIMPTFVLSSDSVSRLPELFEYNINGNNNINENRTTNVSPIPSTSIAYNGNNTNNSYNNQISLKRKRSLSSDIESSSSSSSLSSLPNKRMRPQSPDTMVVHSRLAEIVQVMENTSDADYQHMSDQRNENRNSKNDKKSR